MSLREAPGPYFGEFGGRYMPESLIAAIDELTAVYEEAMADPAFELELRGLLHSYAGRPSALTEVPRFAAHAGGGRVFLKREDLNHTGSHKINNVLGQALLTKRLGKTRVIAETGAGQHGVATATAAALFGFECTIYMGEVDTQRQALNVARMRLLGAEVIPVTTGSRTLKDAINDAYRDWVASVETTNYIFGTAAGPHPFPAMVRDFQKIIGEEARAQLLDEIGRLPDAVFACVGGGSNAIGMFDAFLDDESVKLYGVEAAGDGVDTARHAASIERGRPGVLHGAKTFVLQDEDGQTIESHSISAGLDYPGVGPEHSWLAAIGRAEYIPATDTEAMEALRLLSRTEGIIPAIESAHALAGAMRVGRELGPGRRHRDQPVRARRQGHGHRRPLVRALRRRRGAGRSSGRRPRGDRRGQGRRDRAVTSRVAAAIDAAHADGRGAFVGYLPLGFPDLQTSIDAAVVLAESGADVLELGPPYSDPVMDGTVIQEATQAALAGGFRLRDTFTAVREITRRVRCPGARHDVLEPGDAVRGRPLRGRPARRGRRRADHSRHHTRFGVRLDRRQRAHGPGPGLPGGPDLHRRAPRPDHRSLDRLRVHRLDDGHHG